MTPAGRIVELKRYRIPAGERAIKAQRIAGHVAVMDVPVDHADRVYLIERHVESQAELQGVVDAYAQHSEAAGVPAILATLRTADELAHAFT
jgi:hypothetical protein